MTKRFIIKRTITRGRWVFAVYDQFQSGVGRVTRFFNTRTEAEAVLEHLDRADAR